MGHHFQTRACFRGGDPQTPFCPLLGLVAVSARETTNSLFLTSGLSLSDRRGVRRIEVPTSSEAWVRRKKLSRSSGSFSCCLMLAPLLPGESREEKKIKIVWLSLCVFLPQTPSVLAYAVAFTAGKGIFFALNKRKKMTGLFSVCSGELQEAT